MPPLSLPPELSPSHAPTPVRVRWGARGGGVPPELKETIQALDQWQILQRRWRNRLENLIGDIPQAARTLKDSEIDPGMRDVATQWVAALAAAVPSLGMPAQAAATYIADLEQLCPAIAAGLTVRGARLRRDLGELDVARPKDGGPRRLPLELSDLLPPTGVPATDALRLLTHPREAVRRQIFRPKVEADATMQDRGVLGEWFSAILESRVPESGSSSEAGWAPYSRRPALMSGSRHLPRVTIAPDGTRTLSPPRLRALDLDEPGGGLAQGRQEYLGLLERLVRIPLRGQMQEMIGVWQRACDAWFAEAHHEQVAWTPTLCELAASCADAAADVPLGTGVRAGWWGQSPASGRTPSLDALLADDALVGLTTTARDAAWKRRTPHAMRMQFARRSPQAMELTWLAGRAGSLDERELAALRENPGYGDDQRRTLLAASVDVLLREPGKYARWRAFLLATRRELSAPWLPPAQESAIRARYRNRLSNMPVPVLAALVSDYQSVMFPAADATPAFLAKTSLFRRQIYQDVAPSFTPSEWAVALQYCSTRDDEADVLVRLLHEVPADATPELVRQQTRAALLSRHKEVREAAICAIGRFQSPETASRDVAVAPPRRRGPRY